MGELICLNCKATIEADTFEQADEGILHRGDTCNASPLKMTWDGKPVASVVIHFGPGSEGFKAPGARKSRTVKDSSKEEPEVKSNESSSPKENSSKSTKSKVN